jgi:hypothetical protein
LGIVNERRFDWGQVSVAAGGSCGGQPYVPFSRE